MHRCALSRSSLERKKCLSDLIGSRGGPGIAPEFHAKVWEIFQTLRTRDTVEGSGIGLSTVKKIVESRGGRVAIDSLPGQGARLLFWCPTNES